MTSSSYWRGAITARISRRRALAVTGTTALGAALLAACGGDKAPTASGPLAKPVDTTSQAKRGGKLTRDLNADLPSLDPHGGGPIGAGLREFVWSRLFRYKPGLLEPSKQEIGPDIAETWEWTNNGMTLTVKLRQGVKFHNIPPINGRVMDSGDIVVTWDRFAATSANRSLLANSVNPTAPILSVTAPDARTVVFQMKEPLVYVENFLGHRGLLNIIPKEAKDLDMRQQMYGSGSYQLLKWEPAIGLSFKRHEGYWEQNRPLLDQVDYRILSDYSDKLAQFRVGSLLYTAANQSDILTLKNDVSQLKLYEADVITESRQAIFGWQDPNLKDERVRQALSMSIDRDAWLDAQYNADAFAKAGLNAIKRWHTSVECGEQNSGWWLDPKGSEFGENAKYFKYNVPDAKKLLAAAGFSEGLELTSNHITSTENGADYVKYLSLFESMAAESGFKFKKNIMSYDNYFNNIRTGQGKFTGISYKLGPINPSGDAVGGLNYEFSPTGGVGFHGFPDPGSDTQLEAQLKSARSNFDVEARKKIVKDAQKYLATKMYNIRWPGGATGYELAWPALKNFRVFRGGDQQETVTQLTTWWIDDTQPPIAKS
jgi:peptide/nickel transport system substrate-binding protein